MKKKDVYWIIQITHLASGKVTHVMDRYHQQPERFDNEQDAVMRAVKMNGKLINSGYRADVVEKSDAPRPMTAAEAKETKYQVAAMREKMRWEG